MERITNDDRFLTFYEMLLDWNKKINLTSITLKNEVYIKHFLDSILPIDLIPSEGKMLDIGSGAGFPAIPIKLLKPNLDITMLDSVNKKILFLNEVILRLNLPSIRAVHARIEDYKDRSFDLVTARALAPLNVLLEYSLPFLRQGGVMLAYKGVGVYDEITNAKNALNVLGGEINKVESIKLSDDIIRYFVFITKVKDTPVGYPRGKNKCRSNPL